MFADLSTFIDGFLYSESTTKLSKINNSLRYKTIHDPRQSDQIGLSQARRRTPAPCRRLVRFRGIHNDNGAAQFVNKKSPGFLQPLITGSVSL